MDIRKIGRARKGFALVELLLVLSISTMIFSYFFSVGSDFYLSQSLVAERESLISVLRKARTEAMNNTNQTDHGVYVGAQNYTIFQGSSYAGRNQDFDETFPRTGSVDISGPNEVVFTALEGASNASGTITVSNSRGSIGVLINSEGRISL